MHDIRIGTWKLKDKQSIPYIVEYKDTRSHTLHNYMRYSVYPDSSIRILDFDPVRNQVLVQFSNKISDWMNESILDDYWKVSSSTVHE
jgi:hypothetical protein